ncbi:MAG: hypothetical protein MJD61_05320 [Proteobacteria bacterium]|nr:hypothetical protein [Pseudomonadota bacterium]
MTRPTNPDAVDGAVPDLGSDLVASTDPTGVVANHFLSVIRDHVTWRTRALSEALAREHAMDPASEDPANKVLQTRVFRAYRLTMNAVDPAVIPALAGLAYRHPLDAFFRAMGGVLEQLSEPAYRAFQQLMWGGCRIPLLRGCAELRFEVQTNPSTRADHFRVYGRGNDETSATYEAWHATKHGRHIVQLMTSCGLAASGQLPRGWLGYADALVNQALAPPKPSGALDEPGLPWWRPG